MIEHFPDLYPDEILYSACARFCDHVRYPYKIDVINELFGSEMACAIIDLPCHLRYFVDHLPYGHNTPSIPFSVVIRYCRSMLLFCL